jgi:hypothetical protein
MALAALLQFQDLWEIQPPEANTTTSTSSSSSSRSSVVTASEGRKTLGPNSTAASNVESQNAVTHVPATTAAATTTTGTSSSSSRSTIFWSLIRDCLGDEEPLNRKRALKLLQLFLPPDVLAATPAWGVFLTLFELLDEFAAHLLKATWHLVRNTSESITGASEVLAPYM